VNFSYLQLNRKLLDIKTQIANQNIFSLLFLLFINRCKLAAIVAPKTENKNIRNTNNTHI